MDSIIEQVLKSFPASCWKKYSPGCYVVREGLIPEGIDSIRIEASSGDEAVGMSSLDPSIVRAPSAVYLTVHVDSSCSGLTGYAVTERAVRASGKCVDKIGIDLLIGLYDELYAAEKKRQREATAARLSLVIKLLEKGPPKASPPPTVEKA